MHSKKCPNYNEASVQLSCDGVSENKSNSISVDVYSTCFKNCKNIYPIKLVRPVSKNYKINRRNHLAEVVNDFMRNNVIIRQFIGDNPKRSIAKECRNHASWYACEYCYAKGSKIDIVDNTTPRKRITAQKNAIEEKINDYNNEEMTPEIKTKIEHLRSLQKELTKSLSNLNRKSHILWPSSTYDCTHRSRNSILNIVEKIENNEDLNIDESKGIVGRSVFLDVPNFDFVYDIPTEYMHCGCLGVIKKLTELTFKVGETRTRITTRKLSDPKTFNDLMAKVKVIKEFPRRARDLDFAVFKAQEFRNLALFYFPLVIECIEVGANEREIWLRLAFVLRASCNPSVEFAPLSIDDINNCCFQIYTLYEQTLGARNCNYNLHVFCGHLMEIRTHGPLPDTSAFKFESFYGEVRRAFVPGTISPMKQIMRNILIKRSLSYHCCKNSMFISNYETSLECNNLIYCYQNNKYHIYLIKDINGNNVICNVVGKYPAHFAETPQITWSSVGVFRKGAISADNVIIKKSEIAGKVLSVANYLITCPENIINEK